MTQYVEAVHFGAWQHKLAGVFGAPSETRCEVPGMGVPTTHECVTFNWKNVKGCGKQEAR